MLHGRILRSKELPKTNGATIETPLNKTAHTNAAMLARTQGVRRWKYLWFLAIQGSRNLSTFLLHEPDQVAVGIAHKARPQFVVRHLGR